MLLITFWGDLLAKNDALNNVASGWFRGGFLTQIGRFVWFLHGRKIDMYFWYGCPCLPFQSVASSWFVYSSMPWWQLVSLALQSFRFVSVDIAISVLIQVSDCYCSSLLVVFASASEVVASIHRHNGKVSCQGQGCIAARV